MAGEAYSAEFVIGQATVMVGACEDLWQLQPSLHSLGLIKKFTTKLDMSFVNLAYNNGGNPIFSVMTASAINATMDVYEASARNLSIALGQLPTNVESFSDTYDIDVAVSGSTFASFTSDSDVTSEFVTGDWILIQEGISDVVHVAKLTQDSLAIGTGPFTITLQFDNNPTPLGTNFSNGARVMRVNMLGINPNGEPDYFAAKVVGLTTNRTKPLTVVFPKVRIIKGFDLKFDADNYTSMPFELRPQSCLPEDVSYSDFSNGSVAQIFTDNRYRYGYSYPLPQVRQPTSPTLVRSVRLVTRNGKPILLRNNKTLGVYR